MDLLLNEISIQEFFSPIVLSLKVATIAGILAISFGTIAARLMARKSFRGKTVVETILMLPLVLPPTVIGFFLIIFFGADGVGGQIIAWLFNQSIMFTWIAAVIASTIVAFPLMYQAAKSGFESVDPHIEDAARVDGAKEGKIFFLITIPLAAKALLSGAILSVARALGEFGATLMFAGNIPGETQTIPTAIYIALGSGNMILAWAWVISIVILSFLMLLFIRIKQNQ